MDFLTLCNLTAQIEPEYDKYHNKSRFIWILLYRNQTLKHVFTSSRFYWQYHCIDYAILGENRNRHHVERR
jgi:hypothetical protein